MPLDQALLQLGVILALILVNALFASAEIALVTVRRSRLRELASKGNRPARRALALLDHPSRFFATIQVGVTMAGFFASAIGAISAVVLLKDWIGALPIGPLREQSGLISLVVVTGLISFLSLVIGELVPKNMALHHAERWALLSATPVELVARLMAPLVGLLRICTDVLLRLFGVPSQPHFTAMRLEEIGSLVEEAEEHGAVQTHSADMIQGVIELSDTLVHEIMVPRTDIVSLPAECTIDQALRVFLESGHSRLPVYQGSLDTVLGVVHAKDLLRLLGSGSLGESISGVMRPIAFIPEGKKVDETMRDLQRRRSHLAIVADEYGGTAGLVTLEDILEEVVGEIRDEYDVEEPEIQRLNDLEAMVSGKTPVDTVNEELELNLAKGEFDSLGGLIQDALGRIAVIGDTVDTPEVTLEVTAVSGHRIKQVRLRRKSPAGQKQGNG